MLLILFYFTFHDFTSDAKPISNTKFSFFVCFSFSLLFKVLMKYLIHRQEHLLLK